MSAADSYIHSSDSLINEQNSGHPVSAAVALKTIEIMKSEHIVKRVGEDIGPYFQQSLRETLLDHPLVGHIEGVGLIAGIALMLDPASKKAFPEDVDIGLICRDHCFNNGLIMRAVGSRMVLSPPLVISHSEIDELCQKARECFDLTLQSVSDLGILL
ncbi:MAG: aminotransferase class III-fold pyridoxal phosphate-dependent enzyme [Oceanobacter sp.]